MSLEQAGKLMGQSQFKESWLTANAFQFINERWQVKTCVCIIWFPPVKCFLPRDLTVQRNVSNVRLLRHKESEGQA